MLGQYGMDINDPQVSAHMRLSKGLLIPEGHSVKPALENEPNCKKAFMQSFPDKFGKDLLRSTILQCQGDERDERAQRRNSTVQIQRRQAASAACPSGRPLLDWEG